MIQVRTDEIRPNRAQPRANFDQNSIIRLADSIRRYGILQPLTVREADPDDSCKYELIAGERRLRAAKMLGYLTVPCIVKAADEQISAELAIIENLLREDLNMFEEAYGYRKLIENHRLTQEEVAKRMSVSQSAVANKLRLLKLTYEEQKIILESGLTERHARALLRIESSAERLKTLDHIIEHKLNVNATEMYIESEIEKQRKAKRDVSSGEVSDVDASKKAFVSAESAIPKRKEKELSEAVQAIRRRVDTWTANGGSADINIANRPTTVEIVIRLHK
ncbi:MAG: ParB/RepB/Spo0J family partition protein [Clostridia bacterium]|nr:ParB/RepB/Spo0J family partition protein [Clostridia bacterium]